VAQGLAQNPARLAIPRPLALVIVQRRRPGNESTDISAVEAVSSGRDESIDPILKCNKTAVVAGRQLR
jgi:hypothetical protein